MAVVVEQAEEEQEEATAAAVEVAALAGWQDLATDSEALPTGTVRPLLPEDWAAL